MRDLRCFSHDRVPDLEDLFSGPLVFFDHHLCECLCNVPGAVKNMVLCARESGKCSVSENMNSFLVVHDFVFENTLGLKVREAVVNFEPGPIYGDIVSSPDLGFSRFPSLLGRVLLFLNTLYEVPRITPLDLEFSNTVVVLLCSFPVFLQVGECVLL